MGWEDRPGGRYYYRKVRRGGRVSSEYVGGGPAGLWAELGTLERAEGAEAERERERAGRARDEALDASLDELAALADTLMAAALLAGGYHQHNREWRRQRNARTVDD